MNAPQLPSFAEGTRVVYASQGEGTIRGRVTEEVLGMHVDLYILDLDDGRSMKVAHAAAHREFKPIQSTVDLKRLTRILRQKPRPVGNWIVAEQRCTARLGGDVYELAGVVCDLHPRDRAELGYEPRLLYQTALSQLVRRLERLLSTNAQTVLTKLATLTGLAFESQDLTDKHYVSREIKRRKPAPSTDSLLDPHSLGGVKPVPRRRAVTKVQPLPTKHQTPDAAELPNHLRSEKQQPTRQRATKSRQRSVSTVEVALPVSPATDTTAEQLGAAEAKAVQLSKMVTDLTAKLATAERQLEGQRQEVERLRTERERLGAALAQSRQERQTILAKLQRAEREHVASTSDRVSQVEELETLLGSMLGLTFCLLHERQVNATTQPTRLDALQAELQAQTKEIATLKRHIEKGVKKRKEQTTTIKQLQAVLRKQPLPNSTPAKEAEALRDTRRKLAGARHQVTVRNKQLAQRADHIKTLQAEIRQTKTREQQALEQVMAKIDTVRSELFAEIKRRIRIAES